MENKIAIIGMYLTGKKIPPTYFAIHKDSGKYIVNDIASMQKIIEILTDMNYNIVK